VFVPIFYTNFFNGTVWCPWWSKSSQIQQIKVLLLHYLSTHTLDNGSNSWFCLSQSMYLIFFIGIFKQNYKRFLNLFYNKTYQILIIELFQINFNFFTFIGNLERHIKNYGNQSSNPLIQLVSSSIYFSLILSYDFSVPTL